MQVTALTRRCGQRHRGDPGGPGSARVQAPVADAWMAALGYISGVSEPVSWGAALAVPCDQQPQPGAALPLNGEELVWGRRAHISEDAEEAAWWGGGLPGGGGRLGAGAGLLLRVCVCPCFKGSQCSESPKSRSPLRHKRRSLGGIE